jgi:hypothetical protein
VLCFLSKHKLQQLFHKPLTTKMQGVALRYTEAEQRAALHGAVPGTLFKVVYNLRGNAEKHTWSGSVLSVSPNEVYSVTYDERPGERFTVPVGEGVEVQHLSITKPRGPAAASSARPVPVVAPERLEDSQEEREDNEEADDDSPDTRLLGPDSVEVALEPKRWTLLKTKEDAYLAHRFLTDYFNGLTGESVFWGRDALDTLKQLMLLQVSVPGSAEIPMIVLAARILLKRLLMQHRLGKGQKRDVVVAFGEEVDGLHRPQWIVTADKRVAAYLKSVKPEELRHNQGGGKKNPKGGKDAKQGQPKN